MTEIRCVLFLTVYLSLTYCGCYGDPGLNIIDIDNSIKFGQKVNEEVAQREKKIFNISEYRLLLSELPDGRRYGVYDGLLKAKSHLLLRSYLTYNTDGWLFNNYDSDDQNKQRTHDNTPWINEKDPVEFSKSKLCKRLIRAVKDVSKDEGDYYPYRVFGKVIRRGDHTLASVDSSGEGDFTALIFVSEFWRKNYYGELYLYDENHEIVGGATHKSGRVVVYDSTILRMNRPPAVQFLQGQLLFQIQFSKDKRKMVEGFEKVSSYKKERHDAHLKWYLEDYKLPSGDSFTPPDPERHKTFEYTTRTEGRKILVYDGLFSKDLLDNLRDFVLRFGTYFYDDSIDNTSDNVQWIAGFQLDQYIKSPYWKTIKRVAAHASGSDKMFPYDVSINLVRSSDHTRIHEDVGYKGEEEFTCLVYLNQNWTKSNYGETTFFEKNSDDTEIVAQVRPRYGRTVIFDGNIPHSARPPSFNFSGARLTFVTKLHKNEYTGRKKNFQEEHNHFASLVSSKELLEIYSARGGERYAKKVMEESIAAKKEIYVKPTPETEDEEGLQDDEELMIAKSDENGNEDSIPDREIEKNGKNSIENEFGRKYEPEEQPFFSEEGGEDLDEYSEKLASILDGVAEKSPDAVSKIISAHSEMKELEEFLLKEYGDAVVSIM